MPGEHKTEQRLALTAAGAIENSVYVAGVCQAPPISVGRSVLVDPMRVAKTDLGLEPGVCAALEGGLSVSAYTATIVATLGSLGGASPATVPAAIATVMVDVAFITQLQLRLAYDVAVLYRVPLDLSDPDDMWKLIRVAFTIKSGEVVRESVNKAVPAMMRPLIKRFYSGGVSSAAKSLPVVGKFLLQRNIIKIGIPLAGVPLAVGLNRYTTLVAGKHAHAVFRNEARVIEIAEGLSARSQHRN